MIDKEFKCKLWHGEDALLSYSDHITDKGMTAIAIETRHALLNVTLTDEQMIELRDALNEAFPDEDAYYETKEAMERSFD